MLKLGLILCSCAVFSFAGILPFGKEKEMKIQTSLYCAMNGEVLFFAQGLSLPEDTIKNNCSEKEKEAKIINEKEIKTVNETNSFGKILIGILALVATIMGLILLKKKYKKEDVIKENKVVNSESIDSI